MIGMMAMVGMAVMDTLDYFHTQNNGIPMCNICHT